MSVASALTPYVASLEAYDVDMGGPGVHRGLPSTTVTLVLPADSPLRVSWPGETHVAGWSSVGGLHVRPAQIHHDGHQRGVQLGLTPAGARALLGVPAGELAGRLLVLDDLLGETDVLLARLPERLAQTPHARRSVLVHQTLVDILTRRGGLSPRAEVTHALARLGAGDTVGQVADQVGYSRRHLSTLVRRETGLAPAQLRRVVRLQRARGLLGRRPLAEVAARCGYADQAHLSHDWSDLAGCTPTTWVAEEFPFLQDDRSRPAAG